MRTDDYYQLLGVSRYATRDAVRRAYRLRLFDTHPDRNPGDSLASERTRRIIEAYHALTDSPEPASCARAVETPGPEFVPRGGPSFSIPSWALRAAGTIIAVVLMAWIVVTFIKEAFGGPAWVFKPDPTMLSSRVFQDPGPASRVAMIEQPDVWDCMPWYCAQQYQLSSAGDWAATETIRAYEEAARLAVLRKNFVGAMFYRSALQRLLRERNASL